MFNTRKNISYTSVISVNNIYIILYNITFLFCRSTIDTRATTMWHQVFALFRRLCCLYAFINHLYTCMRIDMITLTHSRIYFTLGLIRLYMCTVYV